LLFSKVPGTSDLSSGTVFEMQGQVVGLFAGRMPEAYDDFYAPSNLNMLTDFCYSYEPEESYAVPSGIIQEIIGPFIEQ